MPGSEPQKPETPPLDHTIWTMLSTRAAARLGEIGVETVGQLLELEPGKLKGRGIGPTTVAEIVELMHRLRSEFGLPPLTPPPPPPPPAPPSLRILLRRLDSLPFSVRARSCFESIGAVYLGDVVCQKVKDLRAQPNVGATTIAEIKAVLESQGLSLGMEVPNWLPPSPESRP